jgi:hypothetical protein
VGIILLKIEQLYEKGSNKLNEDALLIQDNLFGVFDGATSLDKYTDEHGYTGAYIAANITRDIFKKNNASITELAHEANSRIREKMIATGIDISKKINLWSTTVAVVKINKHDFDWVQISDSLILVIYEDGRYKLLIKDYDHDKELLGKWKKLADQKVEKIFDTLHDDLIKNRNRAGVEYGNLDGQKEAANFLKSGTESLKNVKHILVFTDGLFIPKENPQDTEDFDTFTSLFLKGGLTEVRDYVRKVEKDDPNCWKYIRFKQFDDIAAISLTF